MDLANLSNKKTSLFLYSLHGLNIVWSSFMLIIYVTLLIILFRFMLVSRPHREPGMLYTLVFFIPLYSESEFE